MLIYCLRACFVPQYRPLYCGRTPLPHQGQFGSFMGGGKGGGEGGREGWMEGGGGAMEALCRHIVRRMEITKSRRRRRMGMMVAMVMVIRRSTCIQTSQARMHVTGRSCPLTAICLHPRNRADVHNVAPAGSQHGRSSGQTRYCLVSAAGSGQICYCPVNNNTAAVKTAIARSGSGQTC